MERQHQLQNQVQAVLLPGLVQLTVQLRNLMTDTEKRIQAFDIICMRKLLRIFYLERKTNEFVRARV